MRTMNDLNMGTEVWVEAAGGERLRRRVVAVENDRVYVTTDEEYKKAAREGRQPLAPGFRPDKVRIA